MNSINKPPSYPEYKGEHEKKEKKEKQINSETDINQKTLGKKTIFRTLLTLIPKK